MSVIWANYTALRPESEAAHPLAGVPRAVAQRFFSQFIAAREDRVAALKTLLAANGIELEDDDRGIQGLNDWFRREVQKNDSATTLRPEWFSAALDIGIFLGEVMIRQAPHLKWTLFVDGKRDASYQRPVIMGFRGVQNRKYNVDLPRLVAMYAHRIIEGQEVEPDYFLKMLKAAVERA